MIFLHSISFVPLPEPQPHMEPFLKCRRKAISGSNTKGLMGRAWKKQKVHSSNRIKNVHLITMKTLNLYRTDIPCPGGSLTYSVLLGGPLKSPDPPRVLKSAVQYLRYS